MKAGELFVELLVKVGDQTVNAVRGLKNSLTDITSVSLEAKAALVGVAYGFEYLTSRSAEKGMGLARFGVEVDASVEKIQKWQYAARQTGETNEGIAASIRGVSQTMLDYSKGLTFPMGLSRISEVLRSAGREFDPSRVRDVLYMMDKVKEYVELDVDPKDLRNEVVTSVGVIKSSIPTLVLFKGKIDDISRSKILNDAQIEQLKVTHQRVRDLKDQLERFVDAQVAAYAPTAIVQFEKSMKLIRGWKKDMEEFTLKFPELQKVAPAAFFAIGLAIAALGSPLTALSTAITGIIYLLGEYQKWKEGSKTTIFGQGSSHKGNFLEKALDAMLGTDVDRPASPGLIRELITGMFGPPPKGTPTNRLNLNNPDGTPKYAPLPATPPSTPPVEKGGTKFDVDIHNYGVEGQEEIGQSFTDALKYAVKQSPALTRVT